MPMQLEIRQVFNHGTTECVSFGLDEPTLRSCKPDRFGIYRREKGGTLRHIADYLTLAGARKHLVNSGLPADGHYTGPERRCTHWEGEDTPAAPRLRVK